MTTHLVLILFSSELLNAPQIMDLTILMFDSIHDLLDSNHLVTHFKRDLAHNLCPLSRHLPMIASFNDLFHLSTIYIIFNHSFHFFAGYRSFLKSSLE